MRTVFLLTLALLMGSAPSSAQFFEHFTNPTLTVTLNHPPALGLQLDKVAFAPTYGECDQLMVDSLISKFLSHGVEVLDRQNLDTILAEHDLTLDWHFDKASAAKIGQILGPSALIFVKVPRCDTDTERVVGREKRYDEDSKRSYYVNAYYSKTRAYLKASVQTVDLTTGRIFAARAIEASPEESNKSYSGYPVAPDRYDVLDDAISEAVFEVHKMFLPWSEDRELIFYNNDKCNLKSAFQTLRVGDVEGALALSQQNLELCRNTPKIKPKIIAHAHYNLGMLHLIRDEHEQALSYFQEAARIRPGTIVTKAIAECRHSQELLAAMHEMEERTAFEAERKEQELQQAAAEAASSTLTNEDVVAMSQKKLPNAIIIQKIKSSPCDFDTSPDALVALTEAGVSEDVVIAMMDL